MLSERSGRFYIVCSCLHCAQASPPTPPPHRILHSCRCRNTCRARSSSDPRDSSGAFVGLQDAPQPGAPKPSHPSHKLVPPGGLACPLLGLCSICEQRCALHHLQSIARFKRQCRRRQRPGGARALGGRACLGCVSLAADLASQPLMCSIRTGPPSYLSRHAPSHPLGGCWLPRRRLRRRWLPRPRHAATQRRMRQRQGLRGAGPAGADI